MIPTSRWPWVLIGVVALARLSTPGIAQSSNVAGLTTEPSVRQALDFVRSFEQETVREQIRLCEIPAPPFGEAKRAAAYADSMRAVGLTNVRLDSAGNVLGARPIMETAPGFERTPGHCFSGGRASNCHS